MGGSGGSSDGISGREFSSELSYKGADSGPLVMVADAVLVEL